jgi:C1A family cysteine protease
MYRTSSRYGWKPDLPDHRDLVYAAPAAILKKLPSKIDLRPKCPPVYNQGQLESCTGNAIAGAFEFDLLKQNAPDFTPSRLFIYYNERVIENTVSSDSGAEIRDGIKSINTQGVCPETMWLYIASEFAQKPFASCYTDALNHKSISFHRITRDINQMKGCLADGYPFVIGFTVYNSFESTEVEKTGILNMPTPSEKVVGGHAVLVVGYDDSQKRFIVRNSWGSDWGISGYFTMPYDYLLNPNLSDDFWTIRVVTNNPLIQQPNNSTRKAKIAPNSKNTKTNKSKSPAKGKVGLSKGAVTIDGNFTGSTNNSVTFSIVSIDPDENFNYTSKEYNDTLNETVNGLVSGHKYAVNFDGFTAGEFDLTISGDFQNPNPLTGKVTNDSINLIFFITMN